VNVWLFIDELGLLGWSDTGLCPKFIT